MYFWRGVLSAIIWVECDLLLFLAIALWLR